MKKVSLSVSTVDTEKPHIIRKEGLIPAVVYGSTENVKVKAVYNDLLKAFRKAGSNSIVDLKVGDKTIQVIFYEVQKHPVTERIIHVDFYAVDLNKPVQTNIPLHFEGDAEGVRLHKGILVTERDMLNVKCLPNDLEEYITVDLGALKEIGSAIHIGDIAISEKIEVMDASDLTVVHIVAPKLLVSAEEETKEEEGEVKDTEVAEEPTE